MSDASTILASTRAPLTYSVFRALWLATVVSNVGTWMHDIGAGWLMTGLSSSPLLIALVQAATTFPIFLLALPAGAMADIVDRRHLLLAAQALGLVAAAALALLTWQGLTTPWVLLTITFVLGTAAALSAPAFQAIVPELVDKPALLDAIALNSLGINISRAIGPALGGVIVALAGPAAVFALNAISVLAVIFVLSRWKRAKRAEPLPPEHFVGALKAGYRYARHAQPLRLVLIRAIGFFLFGSAVWAMLPLIARRTLRLDAAGYGALLAWLGAGAILGALLLKRLKTTMSPNTLSIVVTMLFALVSFVLAHATNVWVAGVAMAVAGLSWIGILTCLNVAAQMASASWVKARALAIYLLTFQGAMTGGSILWGAVAARADIPTALTIAALGQAMAVVLALRWPLPSDQTVDRTPAGHWAVPETLGDPHLEHGPVLVEIEYRIAPDRVAAFAVQLRRFKTVRQRDGAIRWNIWQDVAEPGRVIEAFVVESWLEHQRQHARIARADQIDQAALNAFHLGDTSPVVRHLLMLSDRHSAQTTSRQ